MSLNLEFKKELQKCNQSLKILRMLKVPKCKKSTIETTSKASWMSILMARITTTFKLIRLSMNRTIFCLNNTVLINQSNLTKQLQDLTIMDSGHSQL